MRLATKRLCGVLCSLLTMVIVAGLTTKVNSQTAPRPNAAVSIFGSSGDVPTTDQAFLMRVLHGNNEPSRLMNIAPEALLDISTEGKLIAVMGGSDTGSNADAEDRLAYGFIDQALRVVPIGKGHRVMWSSFSPDTRYLTYTTAAQETEDWVLGLIDLSNANQIEFTGNTAGTDSVFAGAANVVGWAQDGKTLYLRNYMPFSASGGFDSLYALDLSKTPLDKPGHYPMPPATRLVPADQEIINLSISSDGSKVALMFADPTNPPANFHGTDIPPGIVSIRETSTGSEIMAIKSEQGQAFVFSVSWSPDSQTLVLAGGAFNQMRFVTAPALYVADLSTKQVTKTQTTIDPQAETTDLLACSDAVFYVLSKDDSASGAPIATLYSASYSNLAVANQIVSSTYINALKCIQ
jgi:WD40 repeat protein